MSGAIGPGDWVECVNNGPLKSRMSGVVRVAPELTVGALYIVGGVSEFGGLLLEGFTYGHILPNGYYSSGHMRDRFRPIYRPKSTFIERLMQPAPELETA